MDINQTLKERGVRYGGFKDYAFVAQELKRVMCSSPKWSKLSDDKKQALEAIAGKIARILTGDPEYHDNWWDISGYGQLVSDTLFTHPIASSAATCEGCQDIPPGGFIKVNSIEEARCIICNNKVTPPQDSFDWTRLDEIA